MQQLARGKDPRLEAVLAGVFTAAALLFLSGLGGESARLGLKPVPALALAFWVFARRRDPPGRLTTAGLLLSALGDVVLESGRFLPGLVAFLAAHIAYVLAFVLDERRPRLLLLLPFAAWSAGAFGLLRPGLGAMALPVGVYVCVITVMMWRAAARVGSPHVPTGAARAGALGAVAFGASDTLIAFDRFLEPMPGARVPILVLYWLGQLGIAASMALARPRARQAPQA
jgi:alkenylglycerophosphocholine hydrolase